MKPLAKFLLLGALFAWFGKDGAAQIQPYPGGGGGGGGSSPCIVSGGQTTGYVLTATNSGNQCSWQTVGSPSVDQNTVKNAWFLNDTGTANAITGTTTTTYPGAYAKGQTVILIKAASNTGAVTININSLGNKAVTKNGTNPLTGSEMMIGVPYMLIYDNTEFQIVAAAGASIPVTSNLIGGDGAGGLSATSIPPANVIVSTGSYNNPPWIVTLAGSKINTAIPCGSMPSLTGDVSNTSCATQVLATHLSSPLPVNQGGTGTTSPGIVGGTNITITGTWPSQTVTSTAAGNGSCTNQVVTATVSAAAPTCTTLTSVYVNTSIAITGVDINTSSQVTVTHLSSPLPVNQGGTGTTSPGLVAGTNVTITGSWPNQTINSTGGGGGGTIPVTTNVLKGDGAGNAADSGIGVSSNTGKASSIDFLNGTALGGIPAHSFRLEAPASISASYAWHPPAADAAGFIKSDGSGNLSIVTIGGTCTNQVATAIGSTAGAPTCTTITSSYVNNTIAITGVDINASSQVQATHLSSALPVNQGGTGTASPGLVAGTNITITGSWPNQTINSSAGGAGTGSCTNQVVTAVNVGAPTCTTITSSYVNNSIALTGVDINTSNQVTVTHLASALPVLQGGTGTTTPALVAGTNITITGSWPNQTINSTAGGAGTGACTNQAVTAVNTGAPTCTTLTSAYVNSSIAQTGVDINTSFQVTATHLASALPVNQGGTGTTSPAIVGGSNITVSGSWPGQTVAISTSVVQGSTSFAGAPFTSSSAGSYNNTSDYSPVAGLMGSGASSAIAVKNYFHPASESLIRESGVVGAAITTTGDSNWETDGVVGMVVSKSKTTGSVAGSFFAAAIATTSPPVTVWSTNLLVQDVDKTNTTCTGQYQNWCHYAANLISEEIDANVYDTGTSYSGTNYGITYLNGHTSTPTSAILFNEPGSLGSPNGNFFDNGIYSNDFATDVFAHIGRGQTVSTASQFIDFTSGGSSQYNTRMWNSGTGLFVILPGQTSANTNTFLLDTSGNMFLDSGNFVFGLSSSHHVAELTSAIPSGNGTGLTFNAQNVSGTWTALLTSNRAALIEMANGGIDFSATTGTQTSGVALSGTVKIMHLDAVGSNGWLILATSCSGVPSGAIYNNGGTPAICP
jgi:hypothetical protein